MALANAKRWAKKRTRALTAVLTVVGYALVLGTLVVGLPIYPDLSTGTVNLLSHAIAGINTTAVVLLVLGWRWIRMDEVDKHRAAMGAAFGLILVFLVLYLLKTGGGGTKAIDLAMGPIKIAYLGMLAIHVLLSILAVPVVLYALILGSTHTPAELRTETPHKRIGRIAAGSWIVSLVLGVLTYAMLNHIYGYDFAAA
ncbi:MAG: putative membrane protein [Halobacteriales archaeon]|jgi:putative membrane protein